MFFFTSSKKISDSGLLNGYTDYHCHLLPGVDDGSQKMSHTLRLLKMMKEQGVEHVWFTPHIMEDMPNEPQQLREVFDQVMKELEGHPSIVSWIGKLSLAAENMLDNNFSFERAKQLSLPDNHILVETSYFTPPYNLQGKINDIMTAGMYPMLAHPCRYQYMNEKDYESWRAKRVHFQLNLPAACGLYGKDVQKKAFWLLDNGYYSVTGTDTHSIHGYQGFLDAKLPRKRIEQIERLIHLA